MLPTDTAAPASAFQQQPLCARGQRMLEHQAGCPDGTHVLPNACADNFGAVDLAGRAVLGQQQDHGP